MCESVDLVIYCILYIIAKAVRNTCYIIANDVRKRRPWGQICLGIFVILLYFLVSFLFVFFLLDCTMYIYIYICIHRYLSVYLRTYIPAHPYAYLYIPVHTCTYLLTYVYTYARTYMSLHDAHHANCLSPGLGTPCGCSLPF